MVGGGRAGGGVGGATNVVVAVCGIKEGRCVV